MDGIGGGWWWMGRSDVVGSDGVGSDGWMGSDRASPYPVYLTPFQGF